MEMWFGTGRETKSLEPTFDVVYLRCVVGKQSLVFMVELVTSKTDWKDSSS